MKTELTHITALALAVSMLSAAFLLHIADARSQENDDSAWGWDDGPNVLIWGDDAPSDNPLDISTEPGDDWYFDRDQRGPTFITPLDDDTTVIQDMGENTTRICQNLGGILVCQ